MLVFFGLVIGQVSQMIVNADRRREHTRDQLERLGSLIKHYELPADLQRKTYKFFRHVLSRSSNEEEQTNLGAPATCAASGRFRFILMLSR